MATDICKHGLREDSEIYNIKFSKSNLDYHLRLIEHDDKTAKEVAYIEAQDEEQSEKDTLLSSVYEENRKTCKKLFREHWQEMQEIDKELGEEWEQRETLLVSMIYALKHCG